MFRIASSSSVVSSSSRSTATTRLLLLLSSSSSAPRSSSSRTLFPRTSSTSSSHSSRSRLLSNPSHPSPTYRYFSASSSSPSSNTSTSTSRRSKLAIGGSKLAGTDLDRYASVLTTSLECGVTTFESGHGGEANLAKAYETALMNLEKRGAELEKGGGTVTLTGRFGYRTLGGNEDGTEEVVYEGDVPVESTTTSEGSSVDEPSSSEQPSSSEAKGDDGDKASDGGGDDVGGVVEERVVHNLSSSYVSDVLSSSPLVELRRKLQSSSSSPPINLIYLAHNPETQGSSLLSLGAPVDEIRDVVKERLTDAFAGLEVAANEDMIDGYGVCSNGLSLPKSHPMHLPWLDVLECASDAVRKVRGTKEEEGAVAKLKVLQLPANLLETEGLTVARDVKAYLSDGGEDKIPNLPFDVNVFVTRPLTCYPDRGTGTGKPFKLVDYQIPIGFDSDDDDDETSSSRTEWTHLVEGTVPPQYPRSLNEAMSRFDATHLLEEAQTRKLTMDERETLDGCKLLQSMIHDLDAALPNVRSFATYEEELYERVVPLIHDTFEGLDEGSADVLQTFFAAHGAAVRQSIARTTRTHLKDGGDGIPPYDIPDDWTLQRYALYRLLRNEAVSKIVVGCPKPEHVIEAVEAADGSLEEEEGTTTAETEKAKEKVKGRGDEKTD